MGGGRIDPSIVDLGECEERGEEAKDRGPCKGPAEIKRAACHTSTVVLIYGPPHCIVARGLLMSNFKVFFFFFFTFNAKWKDNGIFIVELSIV